MSQLIKSLALLLAFAGVCLANGFTDDNETPFEPFVNEKAELFRFSRSALKGSRVAKYEQQQQQQRVENDQLTTGVQQEQQVDLSGQNVQQQQVVGANEMPAFSSGGSSSNGGKTTGSQVAVVDSGHQQHSSSSSSSSSHSLGKKSGLSKTITTTTTTTTTTQNNQDQPQVAQIKEIRVHTVPLSEAVHYANYVVVPTGGASKAAHLEESSSSSSSSSHKSSSSSSTASETEQVGVAPAPTVVFNPPPPASVSPDCVLHRLVIERPVSSQLVVQVPAEVKVSHSSSSSVHSSKIVSQNVAPEPQHTVYTYRRVFAAPQPIVAARVVAAAPAPAADGLKEEQFHSEVRSSRQESHGLGHSMSSSSSSSSSSRTSKSSSTSTTSQTAALVAPPPPVQTVTIVRHAPAPIVAVKAAPLVQVSSGQSNDVSVNVDQSGPNYKYGYSIKQHSSEPGTKGVVVGERVVYLK